jgi:hypothetical protein
MKIHQSHGLHDHGRIPALLVPSKAPGRNFFCLACACSGTPSALERASGSSAPDAGVSEGVPRPVAWGGRAFRDHVRGPFSGKEESVAVPLACSWSVLGSSSCSTASAASATKGRGAAFLQQGTGGRAVLVPYPFPPAGRQRPWIISASASMIQPRTRSP